MVAVRRWACLGLGAAVALLDALGVATLLLAVPAWLGTLHQANAVLVLTAALLALRRLPAAGREPARAAGREPARAAAPTTTPPAARRGAA